MSQHQKLINAVIDAIDIWFNCKDKNPFISKNEDFDGYISIYKLIKYKTLASYSQEKCLIVLKAVITANPRLLEFSLNRTRVRKLIK